ncbi:hypothetical protein ACET3X_009958 [Alternaria dauci]|uniref:Zn(2)-C6 fungal-type domain-containing protein n=1 Tax=Alternaria dauci TaxID=48095 RepID=A0ABR3U7S3_9PLEO
MCHPEHVRPQWLQGSLPLHFQISAQRLVLLGRHMQPRYAHCTTIPSTIIPGFNLVHNGAVFVSFILYNTSFFMPTSALHHTVTPSIIDTMFHASTQAFPPLHSRSPPIDDMMAGHEIAIMPTSLNGVPKIRKMRASCDACSRAKVKCDKVRPTCHRCGTMNICCNYSPSMRLGKPRKNRNIDGSIKRDMSPAGSYVPLGARVDLLPRTTSYTYESSPEPTDPLCFGPRTPEYHYQDAFLGNRFEGSQSSRSSEGIGPHSNTWSNGEQMLFAQQADLFAPVPQYPPPHTAFHGHVRSTSVQSQPEMLPPLDQTQISAAFSHQFLGVIGPDDARQEKTMVSPPPMMASPLPTPPISHIPMRHDCTQFAFQILCSLYAPPETQSAAGEFDSLDSLPTLGSVLSTNTAAIDRLYTLLSCECASNPHYSATINLTMMKILSWYEEIAGVTQQDGCFSTVTHMDMLSHPRIFNGDLSSEHEHTYRTNHILAELCRLEKLIDKFSKRYCNPVNTAETGIQCGVYVAMEKSLRSRVRETFRITMSAAPENVKRQMATQTQSCLRVNTV